MKNVFVLMLFFTSYFLYAQSRDEVVVVIPMPTGGTVEQQLYFRDNFAMELTAAGYTLSQETQIADYTLQLEVKKNMIRYSDGTEEDVPPEEKQFVLAIHLIKNEDNHEVVYFEFPFTTLGEMNQYNLYLLYNAMANVPLTKWNSAETLEEPLEEPLEGHLEGPLQDLGKWLWLGLRTGSSFRFYNPPVTTSVFLENEAISFYNVNVALQVSVHLLPWLDVQAEVNFTTDYAPLTGYTRDSVTNMISATKTSPLISQSLMIPLLARFNLRREPLMAGVLVGPYVFIPLGQMQNDRLGGSFDYKTDLPIGYTVGVNFGTKAGPGYLFMDTRWAADLGPLQRASDGTNLYKRSMITLNIGYELGFFTKKPK